MLTGSTENVVVIKLDTGYQIEIQCMGYDELDRCDTYQLRSFDAGQRTKNVIEIRNKKDRREFRKLLKYFM